MAKESDNLKNSFRLSSEVLPSLYQIELEIDPFASEFVGSEVIDIEVKQFRENIELNEVDLTINKVSLLPFDSEVIFRINAEEEKLIVERSNGFDPGNYKLEIKFSGPLNQVLRGLYKSVYKDEENKEHFIAATHFEPADARRAFICFDEPDKKAKFQISIVTKKGFKAFSNWPVKAIYEVDAARVRYEFYETIKMSTYLVAFVVGQLAESNEVYHKDVPIKVVCVPGKESMASFALDVARFALDFFTNYFQIPYPGKKLDLIALPDFAFGAMENLGAVTFRETALLADLGKASRNDLERVADVVAHELAHMWFGDLVTMKWWNGIWLNEAFATFMELKCVDAFRPEWKRWISFGLSRESAMAVDSTSQTRPIEYEVILPEDAEGMFDVLTYQKGAAVLAMLEKFIKEDVFQRGINGYLLEHEYSNCETGDLWNALDEAYKLAGGQISISDMMDSWIFQGGYPLVSVTETGNVLEIRQELFTLQGGSELNKKWIIPIEIRRESGARETIVLEDFSKTIDLGDDSDPVYCFNSSGYGFYRVRYFEKLFERVIKHFDKLDELERFNLVSDTYYNTMSGRTSLKDTLDLIKCVSDSKVKDPNIWTLIVSILTFFQRILGEKDQAVFRKYTNAILKRTFDDLGWEKEGESELDKTLRAILLEALGTLAKDRSVREIAQEMFLAWKNHGLELNPDLKGAILYICADMAFEGAYDAIKEGYLNPKTPQDEQRHLFALGSFKQPDQLRSTLDLVFDVRSQDAPFLLAHMLTIKENQELTWNFIETNYQKIISNFPANGVTRMLESVRTFVGSGGDDKLAKEAGQFLKANMPEVGKKTVLQALERLDVNVAFAKKIADELPRLLSNSISL